MVVNFSLTMFSWVGAAVRQKARYNLGCVFAKIDEEV